MLNAIRLTLVWLAMLLASCGSQGDATTVVLTGSSTVAPLVGELARAFERVHTDVRVDVQTGGSSRGIQDALKGLADIGMASRGLKDGERELTPHTVAWDGITLIVNSANPVTDISHAQVQQLFTGQLKSWSALGGPQQRPVIVNKAEGRSTLELFLEHFELDNSQIAADVVIGDNQQGLKTVVANQWAIAYVSIGATAYEAAHGAPIRLLRLDGVEPSLANIANGRFPLSRPLNLLTHGPISAAVGSFVDFASSQQVVPLIKAQYFVPPVAR